MILTKHKYNYNKNLAVSFIMSIVIVICIFLFTPEPMDKKPALKTVNDFFIPIEFIPATIQPDRDYVNTKNNSENKSSEHKAAEKKVISQIEIQESNADESTDFATVNSDNSKGDESGEGNSTNFFAARQLLEVMPIKNEDFSGSIKLSLLVGTEGKVVEHIIITNTIECDGCVNQVLNAVYNSRWQPIVIDGRKREFWTEKLYEFN